MYVNDVNNKMSKYIRKSMKIMSNINPSYRNQFQNSYLINKLY